MFIFLLFVSSCYSNLISDREFMVQRRIQRFNSEWDLYTAYSDLHTLPEMRYMIDNIGNYPSRHLALTHDEIAVIINKITGQNIITIKSLYLPINNTWIAEDILITKCLINLVVTGKEHTYYETKYWFFVPESRQIYYEHSIPDKDICGIYADKERCLRNYSACVTVLPMKSPYICQCIDNQTNCVIYDNAEFEPIYYC